MKRRDFLKKAGTTAAVATAATVVNAPFVHAAKEKKIKWKMVTTWAPKAPYLQTGAERFADRVKELTGGKFEIRVYAGGELVPNLETFQAVSTGQVEAGSGASYYQAGKEPAAQWFAAVPFGLNAQGMGAWLWAGNGLKLWEETYAPFGVIPRPCGNTGVQMGGWFNKEINSIDDFKGLKMRIPGLGGKVVAKAGGTVVLLAGAEIFTSLERGVIDATEWVGPLLDSLKGFYKVAKYYYYPGWHEPGTVLENIFNKKAYEALPKEYQTVLDVATYETWPWMLSGFEADNGAALEELITKHGVKLVRFPETVMDSLSKLSAEVLEEEAAKSPMAKKVNEDFKAFKVQVGRWGEVSEKAYYDLIMAKYKLS
ncbi:MAG: TRAP transporter substrate-binding protein [Deltaproteobacteria bacterium]|nr:TRAP transporter substrate-binding protein [Deltaproteobacteria bacterium]